MLPPPLLLPGCGCTACWCSSLRCKWEIGTFGGLASRFQPAELARLTSAPSDRLNVCFHSPQLRLNEIMNGHHSTDSPVMSLFYFTTYSVWNGLNADGKLRALLLSGGGVQVGRRCLSGRRYEGFGAGGMAGVRRDDHPDLRGYHPNTYESWATVYVRSCEGGGPNNVMGWKNSPHVCRKGDHAWAKTRQSDELLLAHRIAIVTISYSIS